MADKITYGVAGVVSASLIWLAFYSFSSDISVDNAYICTITNEVAYFERLSLTSKTGYYNESGIEKSKVCTNGKWIPLKEYLSNNNVSIPNYLPKQYKCNKYNCTIITP